MQFGEFIASIPLDPRELEPHDQLEWFQQILIHHTQSAYASPNVVSDEQRQVLSDFRTQYKQALIGSLAQLKFLKGMNKALAGGIDAV